MSKLLSDEERAAKEARLRELRNQMNGLNVASPSSLSIPPQCANQDDYNDEDATSSADYEDEDEFLEEAARAQAGMTDVCMYSKPMDELLGVALETGPNARRTTVGDFELLRLAKMGDIASFTEFAEVIGVDPTTFRDNHGRNALHYAADSGCIPLLQYLIEKKVPFKRDEKMMTPINVAALNQHEAAVKVLEDAFPQAEGEVKTYEEAIESFGQPPPKFTISKPAPTPSKESRIRAFWKTEECNPVAPTTISSDVASVTRLTEKHHDSVVSALSDPNLTQEGQGFNSWLQPAEAETMVAILPRATVVGVVEGVDTQEVIRGLVVAVPLGGSIRGKSGTSEVKDPMLVSQLVLHPSLRGKNLAAKLLEKLRWLLQDAGTTTVVFRSALQLPVQNVGLVKWFRRSIAPCSVFLRHYAMDVFPDFYQYDNVMRADIVAKNALTRSFRDKMMTHRANWRVVNSADSNELENVREFISHHATTLFELAYLPGTTDDILVSLLVKGLFPFVYVSPLTGAVTDFVVLRLRNSLGSTAEIKTAAVCVYALFTSFKGPEKAEEVLAVSEMLKCETVFIPNMFGFLDNDLTKANFEELLACREYLYVLNSLTKAAAAATPLSKVAIPCAFI